MTPNSTNKMIRCNKQLNNLFDWNAAQDQLLDLQVKWGPTLFIIYLYLEIFTSSWSQIKHRSFCGDQTMLKVRLNIYLLKK